MLEWLVVKIDELLAISVRIAVALEGLTHETRLHFSCCGFKLRPSDRF